MTTLPYCFFPTKVICIDDDLGFVETLHVTRPKNKASFQLFDDAETALSYVNKGDKPTVLFERVLQTQGYPLDCSSVGYLYEEMLYNPHRHEVVSCVLVGEQIQGISGLEACRQITDPHIKKIYLTPNLEQERAVAAFNQGLIDFYVSKDNPKALEIIDNYINQAQNRYFEELINAPTQRLLKEWHSSSQEGSALDDPLFLDYFRSFLQKNKIKEYYLVDLIGSFVCIDGQGKASAFLTFTDFSLARHMLDVVDLLEADPHLGKKIGGHSLPSGFCIPSLYHPALENFQPFVVPVQPFVLGQQRYYRAHIPQIEDLAISSGIVGVFTYKKGKLNEETYPRPSYGHNFISYARV